MNCLLFDPSGNLEVAAIIIQMRNLKLKEVKEPPKVRQTVWIKPRQVWLNTGLSGSVFEAPDGGGHKERSLQGRKESLTNPEGRQEGGVGEATVHSGGNRKASLDTWVQILTVPLSSFVVAFFKTSKQTSKQHYWGIIDVQWTTPI